MTRPTALATALLIAGCASQPAPKAAAIDPSNPAAEEAPPASLTPLVGGGAQRPEAPKAAPTPEAAPEHQGHDHGGKETQPSATTYTCPMHPEISSPKPGKCPKCGMTLVPKAAPPEGAPK
jgi:hypothetical protein